jgi:adenylosuccinate synthase
MIIDLQFGSTGKGLLAGYLAKRNNYDTAVCSFATNAGHTYIDQSRGLQVMTQQLPTAITSPTVKNVLIGPGALIHARTLDSELIRYADFMKGKTLMIHPNAAIVDDYHKDLEIEWGMSKMGSTTKGVGAAMIERIRRSIGKRSNVAKFRLFEPGHFDLAEYVVTEDKYRECLEASESAIVEGAQGYSLSMYHGFYPYTTSRDVTPWQIAADCGLPFKWASYIQVCGTLRTFPIRVNNRDGSSGPGYPDQHELAWADLGFEPEKTTVTKLDRRVFSFSEKQLVDAMWHCGGYWQTRLFLNFANYHRDDKGKTEALIALIEKPREMCLNAPRVEWIGYGPDDDDVITRDLFDVWPESEGGIA